MIVRIHKQLERVPEPGPWINATCALVAETVLTEDAAYSLIDGFLEYVTQVSFESDPEMLRILRELARVRREHGLPEGEDWCVGEGPEEWVELNEAWERRDHEIRVATLRALGHGEIAEVLERDPEEFRRRSDRGDADLWEWREDEHVEIRPELN